MLKRKKKSKETQQKAPNAKRRGKLATKLILSFLVLLAFTGVMGFLGIRATKQLESSSEEVTQTSLPVVQKIGELRGLTSEYRSNVLRHLIEYNPVEMRNLEDALAKEQAQIEQMIAEFAALISSDEARETLQKVVDTWARYTQVTQKLIETSRNAETKTDALISSSQERSGYNWFSMAMDELVQFSLEHAANTTSRNNEVATSARRFLLVSTGAAVIAGMLLALWLSITISRPLKAVTAAAQQVAGGDLSISETNIKSNDETAALAEAFNTMVTNLRALAQQVKNTAEMVAVASQQLTGNVVETTRATQEIAGTVEQVSAGAETQAAETERARDIISGIALRVSQVTAAAERVTSASYASVREAENGSQVIQRAVEQMQELKRVAEESSAVVNDLGIKSHAIGKIVEVITAIAEQTNLLALNAAIESARAGEQGRGFAVVADEVRKLAEGSAQAANEIAQLVREINQSTGKAVTSMGQQIQQVDAGARAVQQADEAFARIVESSKQARAMTEEIAVSIKQVEEGSQQVVTMVERIAAVTAETAAGMQEVAASIEEQTASMEEIASSAEHMSNMAKELEQAMSRFIL
ncbi:hypothetical protein SY88_18745 [Clostridiales bacterium PH28_bin88]|nr:hypothetical protein SY88_18745 [Clostridiales bacterium PH28_bin88]